jgi:catechol 2,3-dioxygenase-like lactoylglutathione lyase family enzyme
MGDWDREIGAITLMVPDLDRAAEFYEQTFGLPANRFDADNAMFKFKGAYVFLHKSAAAHEPVPEVRAEAQNGAGQFAIIVDDVDAVWAELATRGVQPISGPANRPWGMRTVTFADPAGHIWEIAQEVSGDAG